MVRSYTATWRFPVCTMDTTSLIVFSTVMFPWCFVSCFPNTSLKAGQFQSIPVGYNVRILYVYIYNISHGNIRSLSNNFCCLYKMQDLPRTPVHNIWYLGMPIFRRSHIDIIKKVSYRGWIFDASKLAKLLKRTYIKIHFILENFNFEHWNKNKSRIRLKQRGLQPLHPLLPKSGHTFSWR